MGVQPEAAQKVTTEVLTKLEPLTVMVVALDPAGVAAGRTDVSAGVLMVKVLTRLEETLLAVS